MRQLEAHKSDEVAMSRYRQEHPDEVRVEYEFFAVRNTAEKKIKDTKEEELKEVMWQIDGRKSDEVAMVRSKAEHPEEVQEEYEFFAARGTMKKKKSEVTKEDDAAPLMVIEQDDDDPFYMDIDWDELA
jgi:hypothetical protein